LGTRERIQKSSGTSTSGKEGGFPGKGKGLVGPHLSEQRVSPEKKKRKTRGAGGSGGVRSSRSPGVLSGKEREGRKRSGRTVSKSLGAVLLGNGAVHSGDGDPPHVQAGGDSKNNLNPELQNQPGHAQRKGKQQARLRS